MGDIAIRNEGDLAVGDHVAIPSVPGREYEVVSCDHRWPSNSGNVSGWDVIVTSDVLSSEVGRKTWLSFGTEIEILAPVKPPVMQYPEYYFDVFYKPEHAQNTANDKVRQGFELITLRESQPSHYELLMVRFNAG